MEIGILSDSHLSYEHIKKPSRRYQTLLKALKREFSDVDHIIHAGDVVCQEFIEDLGEIAPITVVQGNMDAFYGNSHWPKKIEIKFDGVSIGITHDPSNYVSFNPGDIQVFIFGHTHIPQIRTNEDGILCINPGSLTQPRAAPRRYLFEKDENPRPTIAFLEIHEDLCSAFIKKL